MKNDREEKLIATVTVLSLCISSFLKKLRGNPEEKLTDSEERREKCTH